MEEQVNETNNSSKSSFEESKKINELLDKGDISGILPMLSTEDREELTERVNEAYEEKNGKLFERYLESTKSETQEEAEKRRNQEDVQDTITKTDLLRSKFKKTFRKDVTENLRDLKESNANGEYLSSTDKHFLEDNDEVAFNNSEQARHNKEREEDFKNMADLGRINNAGELTNSRDRIISEINRTIREKQQFIAHGGDLNNCNVNFDKKLEQLYGTLNDIDMAIEAFEKGDSHKM